MIDKDKFIQAKDFIKMDIERELDLYRKENKSAGNFLCALGLLCYTEFFGGVMTDNFKQGYSKSNFDTFFKYMGKDYEQLLTKVEVYDIFRCGLTHEYFIKNDFSVIALFPQRRRMTGLGHEGGKYFFIVESYYNDFIKAVEKLENELYK